ncbi:MAG: hypothetical protein ABJE95_06310 [Byssovorax sp.]
MLVHRPKSSRIVLAFTALAAAAALTLSHDSRGADPGKEAEEHYLRGKALLKGGDVKGAYLEYRASWDLKQSYDIAANLGNLELEQGLPRDAAEHLAFALRTVAVGVPEDRVETIRGLLDKARRLVGAATVKVNIDGAEILVDGVPVGRSPLSSEIFVDPGKRTIEARLNPYAPSRKVFDFPRAATIPVVLQLVLAAAPTASASAPTVPTAPPTTTARPKSMVPVGVGVAVAAAGLGIGIVGVVLSGSKAGEVDRLQGELAPLDKKGDHSICSAAAPPPQCADLNSAFLAKGSFRNLAIAGFATAGVASLATVVWILIPGPKAAATKPAAPKATPVRASFSAGPSGGSVILSGQF